MKRSLFLVFAVTLVLAPAAIGQPHTSAAPLDRGAYFSSSAELSHNSDSGYASSLDWTVGYDFNRYVAVESGIPFYPLTASKTATASGSTTTTTHYNAVGDAYLRLNLDPRLSSLLKYKTSLTATAPTGDTSAGMSTGRATWKWTNRAEADVSRVTPYVETSLGDSMSDTRFRKRTYTTLGNYADFTGGVNLDLGHNASIDASTYYDLPFGPQKLYSRIVVKNAAKSVVVGGGKHGAAAALAQHVTIGGASLTEDHGYVGSFSFSPVRRVDLSVGYDHSIVNQSNTVVATLGVRLGHMAGTNPPVTQ